MRTPLDVICHSLRRGHGMTIIYTVPQILARVSTLMYCKVFYHKLGGGCFHQPFLLWCVQKKLRYMGSSHGISCCMYTYGVAPVQKSQDVSILKHYAFDGTERNRTPRSPCWEFIKPNYSLQNRKPQSRHVVASLVDMVAFTTGNNLGGSLFSVRSACLC